EKCQKIDSYARRIMEEVGMIIGDDTVRSLLLDNGATEIGKGYISIPSCMVDKALKSVPSGFKLYTVNGELAMDVNKVNKYFGGSTSSLSYVDPVTSKITSHTMETSSHVAKVADALPNVNYLASNGLISDCPPTIAGRMNFSNTLKYTTKPMYFSPDYAPTYRDIIDLARDIKGGAQGLREKPFIFGYCEPVPPFNHSGDSLKKLMMCSEAGVPCVYMPYSMRGGTSPIFLAAALAQNFAEILSGLVIQQLAYPGAAFIAGSMPTILDMKTTTGSYGAPEFHFGIAASAEMADYYNIPFFGTAGCTDSQNLDMQAASEVTMALLSTALTGADIVHDFGVMNHASAISPELYVYTNEVLDMLRVYQGGIDCSDEAFLFETIKKVGPRGHYLEEDSTLENFKSVWYSKIFDRSLTGEIAADAFSKKIKDKTLELIEAPVNPEIDPSMLQILEEHESKWRKLID
ncbi:MAG: trimethylamine methyltransferase family protein, partial [Cloacibacillus sp.]